MRTSTSVKWWIPLAALITLAGYWGPWVDHRVAGLVITGLDLGEYVKFLPSIRSGQVTIWRESFYWPLVAVSLSLSLYAFRRRLAYGWPVRAGMVAFAILAALNLLPPAWTPARLLTAEFRLQSGALVLCLAAMAVSPVLGLLPNRLVTALVLALAALALWFPVRNFLRVLPDLVALYNTSLQPGWGLYGMIAGISLLALGAILALRTERTAGPHQPAQDQTGVDHAPLRPK
jgi:hypothetical protein